MQRVQQQIKSYLKKVYLVFCDLCNDFCPFRAWGIGQQTGQPFLYPHGSSQGLYERLGNFWKLLADFAMPGNPSGIG
jgi:hypothetical protein